MRLPSLLLAGLLMAAPADAQTAMPRAFPVGWSAEPKGLDHVTNRLALPCDINRIEARLKLSNPQRRPQILPSTGLDLVAPGTALETVMLRIEDDGNGHPMLMLKKYGGAKAMNDIHIPVAVAYGQEVPVALGWNAAGEVTVTAGGRDHRMSLSAAPAAVEFFVQGGKGDVSEARFTWQGPAKPPCPAPKE